MNETHDSPTYSRYSRSEACITLIALADCAATESSRAERNAAHRAVGLAIKEGRLARVRWCEGCGLTPKFNWDSVVAHHTDYSKQLDIIWLCQSCHKVAHGFKRSPFTAAERGEQYVGRKAVAS